MLTYVISLNVYITLFFQIIMPRIKSKVCNFFTKVNRNQGPCLKCKKIFEAKGGNTSNLISHLRSHHPNIHLEFLNTKGQNKTVDR